MGGLMRLVVIDSLERFHGAMRNKEAHAVEEAPWARNIGHAQQRFPYDTRCPLLKPSFFNHCPAPRRHAWRHQWLPHPPPSSHLAHANPIFITTRQRQARHICITPMMIPHARQHTRVAHVHHIQSLKTSRVHADDTPAHTPNYMSRKPKGRRLL